MEDHHPAPVSPMMSAATWQSGPGVEGLQPAATMRATIRARRSPATSGRPTVEEPRRANLQFHSWVSSLKGSALHEDQVPRTPTSTAGRLSSVSVVSATPVALFCTGRLLGMDTDTKTEQEYEE